MHSTFRLFFILLISAVLLAACSSAGAPPPLIERLAPVSRARVQATEAPLTASLAEISGSVLARQAQETIFSPASNGYVVQLLGQVQTQTQATARLNFPNGTLVRLGPNTLFTLQAPEESEQGLLIKVQLAVGRLWVVLNGGALEVETKSGVAAVRGSYLSLSYDPNTGQARITCLEGNCSLTTKGGSVDITAGQTAEVTGADEPPQVGDMTPEDVQDWLNHNPEAALVVPALTTTAVASEAPTATETLPTSTPVTVVPPLGGGGSPPTATQKPAKPAPTAITEPSPTPSPVPSPTVTLPPSLVPVVTISNVAPVATVVVGEPVTVTFLVQPSAGGPIPTGGVKILADGISICSATLDASGAGTCTAGIPNAASPSKLAADYSGDVNYLPAQSAGWPQTVTQAATTITIQSQSPNPSVVSTPVVFTATVDTVSPGTGLPTGSVTFKSGLDNCVATAAPWTCSFAFTSAGTKTIIAIYSGDTNFIGNSTSSNLSQEVFATANTIFSAATGPINSTLTANADCSQTFSVDARDVDGVNEVKVVYSDNSGYPTLQYFRLTKTGSQTWSGTLTIPAAALSTVYWRFAAIDGAGNWTYLGDTATYTTGTATYAYYLSSTASCP